MEEIFMFTIDMLIPSLCLRIKKSNYSIADISIRHILMALNIKDSVVISQVMNCV